MEVINKAIPSIVIGLMVLGAVVTMVAIEVGGLFGAYCFILGLVLFIGALMIPVPNHLHKHNTKWK